MRFSSRYDVPPSVWVDTPEDTAQVAYRLLKCQKPYGLDTETDDLGYSYTDSKGKVKATGDGLGCNIEVVCLCFDNVRYGIDVGEKCRANLDIIADAIHRTAHLAAGFNWIFDANVLESNTGGRFPLNTLYADGGVLFDHWDEDGHDTGGRRGLKPRSLVHLGLPMTPFQEFHNAGGIRAALEDPATRFAAQSYCSRDAYAHVALVAAGQEHAERLVWTMECPYCGNPAYLPDASQTVWQCAKHGYVSGGAMLTMWDWHRRYDVPFLALLKRMQQEGVLIDTAYLEAFLDPLRQAREHARELFQKITSEALVLIGGDPIAINPNSPQQLQSFYFERHAQGKVVGLGYPRIETTKAGGAATGEEVMRKLQVQHDAPGVAELLQYRALDKLLSTYVEGLPARIWDRTGAVHTRLRPDTATARLSSRNPNMTNVVAGSTRFSLPAAQIPPAESVPALMRLWGCSEEEAVEELAKDCYHPVDYEMNVRDAIVPPPGELAVDADFDQLEVKLTAIVSGCKKLQEVILSGRDMHAHTAAVIFASKITGLQYRHIYEAKKLKDLPDCTVANLPEYLAESSAVLPMGTLAGFVLAHLEEPMCVSWARSDLKFRTALLNPMLQARSSARVLELARICALRLSCKSQLRAGLYDLFSAGVLLHDEAKDGAKAALALVHEWIHPEELVEMMALVQVRAEELRGKRQGAKAGKFGIIYGIGPMGLAVQITRVTGQRTTSKETKPLIHAIKYEAYPGIGEMIERQHHAVVTYGYVRTLMGRYRHPAGIYSGNRRKISRGKRQAGNSPIQGLAANIMEMIMIALDSDPEWRKMGARLVLQVHDELLAYAPAEVAPRALELMIQHMTTSHGLVTPIPLTASGGVADRWGKIK